MNKKYLRNKIKTIQELKDINTDLVSIANKLNSLSEKHKRTYLYKPLEDAESIIAKLLLEMHYNFDLLRGGDNE